MAQPVAQNKSFNSGEWAPQLWARVDIEKYHSGAALIENAFVDYRGGATSRAGTKYCLRGKDDSQDIRLIPFQAAYTAGYALEFGENYIRFYANGSPVLSTGLAITGVTKANPGVISVVNTLSIGNWVYISTVGGMTELNGHYYKIASATGTQVTLTDLFGNAVDTTAFGTYTAGGLLQPVYEIQSPYLAEDLALLKFTQNGTTMIITHSSYVPYSLILQTATSWILAPLVIGTTVTTPAGLTWTSTLAVGTTSIGYAITAVDVNGQESAAAYEVVPNRTDLRSTLGTNIVIWSAVTNAVSYNVYKSQPNLDGSGTIPAGTQYGFVGNVTGTSLLDSNIAPDYSQGPPAIRNPFLPGAAVDRVVIFASSNTTTYPSVTFSASPSGRTATGKAVGTVQSVTAIIGGGTGYAVGDVLYFAFGAAVLVSAIGGGGTITNVALAVSGSFIDGFPNPVTPTTSTSTSGSGAVFTMAYRITAVQLTDPGTGYVTAPTVTFAPNVATAGSVLAPPFAGNPAVCAFVQQRLCMGVFPQFPQTLDFSHPGSFYNYNVSFPIQDDDAITMSLVSGQINNIKALIPQTSGLVVLADGQSWVINGGSAGSAITPSAAVANPQSFIGSNDMPPIVINYDILYVSSKGSSVRDMSYNFYANVWTGADISLLSSHLFYNYNLNEWAFAEEPYKIVWAVRNDGQLLSLTFLKEQEFAAWAHHVTDGNFKSVCSIVEQVATGRYVNAIYVVVERVINGITVKYIERMDNRLFTTRSDCWCVDCGISYSGAPATNFTGAEFLAGETVTGLADGEIIAPFVMATNGAFTLAPASKVVIGKAFTVKIQTLPIDVGEPTVQGKVKKLPQVNFKVYQTLNIKAGSSFDPAVLQDVRDIRVGEINTMLTGQGANQLVTDIFTGDAQFALDPTYTVPGQYCFQQSDPYPMTILGVFPEIEVGDTK
jgi:hypothetical protein